MVNSQSVEPVDQNEEEQSQEKPADVFGENNEATVNGEQSTQNLPNSQSAEPVHKNEEQQSQEKHAEEKVPEKGVGPDVKIDSVEKYQKEKTLCMYN